MLFGLYYKVTFFKLERIIKWSNLSDWLDFKKSFSYVHQLIQPLFNKLKYQNNKIPAPNFY
jgi:hypothetical protein